MRDTIKHKDFIGSVHYNDNDKVFYGKILGIDDLVTFEGESVEELKAAFIDAVEDYLLLCKEVDKKPDKSYKGSFNVRIPSSMHRQAVKAAQSRNMTLNEFAKNAIEHELLVK
ncbi:MAG: type II toxin-antitoxin system HicB family antitoxin [Candidatus Margulisiibacteriota bacterium]